MKKISTWLLGTVSMIVMVSVSDVLAGHHNNGISSLHFIENVGQITNQSYEPRTDIDFKLSSGGVNLFVSNHSLHYQWYKPAGYQVIEGDTIAQQEVYRMDVLLVGASTLSTPIKEEKQSYYERHYNEVLDGTKAYGYSKLTYKNVYPQIDWVVYTRGSKVEYDFVVHPGGKVSDIQLQYSRASELSLLPCGSLEAQTPFGKMLEAAPISFQQADGKAVASRFVLNGDILSFAVDAYEGVLVIDPVLEWATYFGGTSNESAGSNNLTGYGTDAIYMIGNTPSTSNIATEGSHQSIIGGGTDGFVSKFNAAGVLQWCTYYGGTHGSDNVTGIVCDSEGNVYFGGYTQSVSGISTATSYQPVSGGSRDGFLVKMNDEGERVWATYIGGSSREDLLGMSIDNGNNIYLTGFTQSTNGIATEGVYQTERASSKDAFLIKFDSDGDRLWGTYFGGTGNEEGWASVCDSSGNVYIAGMAQGTDGIASIGAHQEILGGSKDGFIAKFSADGDRLWSTYFGGEADDYIYSICSDGGDVYFTGYTYSASGIASLESFKDTLSGAWDVMIARIDNSGLVAWSTYYGGESTEEGLSIINSNTGGIVISGTTQSTEGMSTPGVYQEVKNDDRDAFVSKFSYDGYPMWGTYIGADGVDQIFGTFLSSSSKLYFSGSTSSYMDFATAGSHQIGHGGSTWDLFLGKFNICETPMATFNIAPVEACAGSGILLSTDHTATALSYYWILPEGWIGSSSAEIIEINAGNYSDSIGVVIIYSCGTSDTAWHAITVFSLPEPVISVSSLVLSTTHSYETYQWYHNGELIVGAVNSTYVMTDPSGEFTVEVSNEHGCIGLSEPYAVPANVIEVPGYNVNIYPNPTDGLAVIETELMIKEIKVYNVLGQMLCKKTGQKHIDIKELSDGLYYIHVSDESGHIGVYKIVKY